MIGRKYRSFSHQTLHYIKRVCEWNPITLIQCTSCTKKWEIWYMQQSFSKSVCRKRWLIPLQATSCLKSLGTWPFPQQLVQANINKEWKLRITGTLWEDPPVADGRWNPLTKGQSCGKRPHIMTWRHHAMKAILRRSVQKVTCYYVKYLCRLAGQILCIYCIVLRWAFL